MEKIKAFEKSTVEKLPLDAFFNKNFPILNSLFLFFKSESFLCSIIHTRESSVRTTRVFHPFILPRWRGLMKRAELSSFSHNKSYLVCVGTCNVSTELTKLTSFKIPCDLMLIKHMFMFVMRKGSS